MLLLSFGCGEWWRNSFFACCCFFFFVSSSFHFNEEGKTPAHFSRIKKIANVGSLYLLMMDSTLFNVNDELKYTVQFTCDDASRSYNRVNTINISSAKYNQTKRMSEKNTVRMCLFVVVV